MTETGPRVCDTLAKITALSRYLDPPAEVRPKLRRASYLYAISCVRRRLWHLLPPSARHAVEVADRFAEGQVGWGEMDAAREAVARHRGERMDEFRRQEAERPKQHRGNGLDREEYALRRRHDKFMSATAAVLRLAGDSVYYMLTYDASAAAFSLADENREEELWVQSAELSDLCGPWVYTRRVCPVDPVVLCWNSATVLRIAHAVYEERAFGQMPRIADALQAAGCVDEELIRHCRSEGPHVRGCWGLDLILDKPCPPPPRWLPVD